MTYSQNNTSGNKEMINAFDAMWGLHPSPVMLLKANRDIVAVNEAGKQLGIPTGVKCFSLTKQAGICNGCQGNACLKDGQAKRTVAWSEKMNMFLDTYWFPVRGEDKLFIHLSNNITEWAKEELCG